MSEVSGGSSLPAHAGQAGQEPPVPPPGSESDRPEPPTRPTGPAAAAVLAAGIGVLTLGGASLFAAAYQPFEQALLDASRLFVPGGVHVGRFGGEELLALVAWLGSWAILHLRLRSQQVGLSGTTGVFVFCLFLGTLLFWPPITRSLATLIR